MSPPAAVDERTPVLLAALDPCAGDLLSIVAELETLARFDTGGAEQRADEAVAAAPELGLPQLEQRAPPVRAHPPPRPGNVAQAGRHPQGVRPRGPANDAL